MRERGIADNRNHRTYAPALQAQLKTVAHGNGRAHVDWCPSRKAGRAHRAYSINIARDDGLHTRKPRGTQGDAGSQDTAPADDLANRRASRYAGDLRRQRRRGNGRQGGKLAIGHNDLQARKAARPGRARLRSNNRCPSSITYTFSTERQFTNLLREAATTCQASDTVASRQRLPHLSC